MRLFNSSSRARLGLAAASLLGLLQLPVTGQVSLDETWTATCNGQTVQVNPDGSFRIPNISAADDFGLGGPGTPPDFLSDDFLRVVATSTIGGVTYYAFSDPFQIAQGERYVIPGLTITNTPPPLPVSLALALANPVLTNPGETTQLATTATLADGTLADVTPRTAWTTYRTSNPLVATVDPDGLVTAVTSGIAFLTAVNDGATSVIALTIALGDPLTTVEGRVLDGDENPVVGAALSIQGLSAGVSGVGGRFSASGIPTTQGQIVAFASSANGSGSSEAYGPVAGAVTDIGDIVLLPTSEGTDFAVCFEPNILAPAALSLFIGGDVAANGSVDVPGLGLSIPFSVVPGLVTTVAVDPSATVITGEGVEDKGVLVSADAPIAVYGLNQLPFTTDGFTALPEDLNGTRYRVLTHEASSNGPSQFAVVGVTDGTTVTIVPQVSTTNHAAGVPYTVDLDRGQVYQLQAGVDQTGTLVASSAPVSVFGGHLCGNVPAGVNYCDHLVEQLTPVSHWGTCFMTVPLAGRSGGDTFRFVADVDNTVITISGAATEIVALMAGEHVERILDGAHLISSSSPVLAAQFAHGSTYDGALGDPFMMLLSSVERFRTRYTFATPASGFSVHYVNVVLPAADLGAVRLDGVPITALAVHAIPGASYVGAQIAIGAGCHVMTAPNPVGIYVYGFNADDSYGYVGGL
jgi:hypothetical protein